MQASAEFTQGNRFGDGFGAGQRLLVELNPVLDAVEGAHCVVAEAVGVGDAVRDGS